MKQSPATRFLYPIIPLRALPGMLLVMVAGAAVAGVYGVIHDQVTYTIGPEYFTRFKFDQFAHAKPASDEPRVFVAIIGFLATWWVGLFAGWGVARFSVGPSRRVAGPGVIGCGFGIVFATAVLAAAGGWGYGQWRRTTGYADSWTGWMNRLGVQDEEAFMTVGYIHNASYLGGAVGLILAVVWLCVRRRRSPLAESEIVA